MISRPELTDQQKLKYETELNAIIALAPTMLQDAWKTNPHITWVRDMPHIQQGIINKFRGALADRYNTLENKRKQRTL